MVPGTMNLDGTNQVNLTNNPSDDRDPDWCCQTPITKEPFLLDHPFVIGGIITIISKFQEQSILFHISPLNLQGSLSHLISFTTINVFS